MSMTDPVFQWLAYELAFIFAILFVWVLLRARRKHKRAQAAAAKTAKLIKNNHEQRFAALSSQLSERYGLSGAALDTMVEELMSREKEIFKSIVNLYSEQDEKSLGKLPEQITSLTDATLSIMQADIEQDPVESEMTEEIASETELSEETAEFEDQIESPEAEEEPVADFDSVFDDENAENVVAQTELLDDETVVSDEQNDTSEMFEIELADVETENAEDISNQNQLEDETTSSDLAEEVNEEPAADSEVEMAPELLAEFDGLATDDVNTADQLEPDVQDGQDLQSEAVLETEAVKPAMRMADFVKNDWNPTVPDIYGKASSELAAPSPEIDEAAMENAGSSSELNSMKAYLNKAWTNQVPDVYGKSPTPDASADIPENTAAFEHQELKFHAFESGDINPLDLMNPVQPAEIELDIDQAVEMEPAGEAGISVAEIDELMRIKDATDEPEVSKKENNNETPDRIIDEITTPEQDDMAQSVTADEVTEVLEQAISEADANPIDDVSPEGGESSAQYAEKMAAVEPAGLDETASDAAEDLLEHTQQIENITSGPEQPLKQEQAEVPDAEDLDPLLTENASFADSLLKESENTGLLVEESDSTVLEKEQEEFTENAESNGLEQRVETEMPEAVADEVVPEEPHQPSEPESNEMREATQDVVNSSDHEEIPAVDELSPETAEAGEPEQTAEPAPEALTEETEPEVQDSSLAMTSSEAPEATRDLTDLPDVKETVALEESSPETAEPGEPEQAAEPAPEALTEEVEPAEQISPLELEFQEALSVEDPSSDIDSQQLTEDAFNDLVETNQTENNIAEAEAEAEAESHYQSEEERLAGIMSAQPIDAIAADENIVKEASKTNEPVNEIEKLRAKLRERTQRLKAARKQHLAGDHAIATQPPIEKAVDSEPSREMLIEEAEESHTVSSEAPGLSPDFLDKESSLEESFENKEESYHIEAAQSDNTLKTEFDKADDTSPQPDAKQQKSPSSYRSDRDAEVDFVSTAKSTEKTLVSPASDKQPYAFHDMPEFIEEEIELSTANGYRMNSTQELISEVKKAPLVSLMGSNEHKSEPLKPKLNDEKTHTNDDEWVSDLLDNTSPSKVDEIPESTVSEKIDVKTSVHTEANPDMDSPENEAGEIPPVEDITQKSNLSQAEEDFAAALAAEQAQAELDRKQTQSEIAVFDIPEQPDLPEPERLESLLKDVEKLQSTQTDKKLSLIPPTQEEPLPDTAQLDSLLGEVDKLTAVKKTGKSKKKRSELQAILSTIPSFSGNKKPKYK